MGRLGRCLAIVGAAALLVGTASVALAADPQADGAPLPQPLLGIGPGGIVQLTGGEQRLAAVKAKLADDYALVRSGHLDRATFNAEAEPFLRTNGGMSAVQASALLVSPMLSSNTLSMSEYAQAKTYYCGPASAYEILAYRGGASGPSGESLSQTNLAKTGTGYLNTEYYGNTPWSPAVMAPTLNTWQHFPFYATQSGATLSTYESRLVWDVDSTYPIALGIYESSSTPHLVGHPTDRVIQHWIAARGYTSSGVNTSYADSVHGSSVSWASGVPAYSTIPSSNMVTMMNAGSYGYIY